MKFWTTILTVAVAFILIKDFTNEDPKAPLPKNPPTIISTPEAEEGFRIKEISTRFKEYIGFWSHLNRPGVEPDQWLWNSEDIIGTIEGCTEDYSLIQISIKTKWKDDGLETANIIGGLYPESKVEVKYTP